MDENGYYLLLLISFAVGAWIWPRDQNQSFSSTPQVWIAMALMLAIIIAAKILLENSPINPEPNQKLESIALEIKDLLKRLPEPSVAKQYHEEIIAALGRGTPAHPTTSGGITPVGATSLFLTLLFLAVAIGIAFFASGPNWNIVGKGFVLASIAPALTLSLLGTLEKGIGIDNLFGMDLHDIHLFTFPSGTPAGTSPQDLDLRIHVTEDEAQLDCGEGDNYKIGPFADGDAEKGNIINLNKKTTDLAGELIKNHARQRLLGLILVGSADKRALKPPLFRIFGSNTGLAQARAEWVRKTLKNSMDPMPRTILTLSAGPAHVGQDPLPEKLLAEDRSVRVCAIWGSK